jgi:hypothetical protein
MKKRIALAFISFAVIIILAHAFVPHCDYNQIPRFFYVHCAESDKHCSSSQSHHHQHNIIEDCILTQAYVKLEEDKQPDISSVDFNSTLLPYLLSLFFADSLINRIDAEGLPFSYKPYLLLSYSSLVAQSIGLRAPPTC